MKTAPGFIGADSSDMVLIAVRVAFNVRNSHYIAFKRQ